MDNPSDPQRSQDENQGRAGRSFNWLFPAFFVFAVVTILITIFNATPRSQINYKDFLNFIEGKDQNGELLHDDN